MNKKLILSKTLLYVVIVGYIILFKTIFGSENTLIGVTSVTAALMFLERDLTLSLWKNIFKLIGVNVGMGLAAYVASSNMWLGIIINFIVMFAISYFYLYDLKKPLYLPFSLQYLFILTSPVPFEGLGIRLLALIGGALSIMLLQVVANRKRFTKEGNYLLSQICDLLNERIVYMKEEKDTDKIDEQIKEKLRRFRGLIYDRRESDYYLTQEGIIKLNLSVGLEKIGQHLSKSKYTNENKKILEGIGEFLKALALSFKDLDKGKDLQAELSKVVSYYSQIPIQDVTLLEELNGLTFIQENLEQLQKLEKEHYNIVKKVEEIPEEFKKHTLVRRELSVHSLKFSYALRMALGITIGGFIMDYFNLSEGRWILFTILSLTVPIYENFKQRAKDRLVATLIGGILVVILFGIIEDATIRTLLLMAAGYIDSYLTKYRYKTILVTFSAIGAAALLGDTHVLTLNRIIFVALGSGIALLMNSYVLPYHFEKNHARLKKMYEDTIVSMLHLVYEVAQGKTSTHQMKNLFITTSLIEDRMKLNGQTQEGSIQEEEVNERRVLVSNIYELYLWIQSHKIKAQDLDYILEDLKNLFVLTRENLLLARKQVEAHLEQVTDLNDKVVLSLILTILKEEYEILHVKESIG